MPLFSRPNMWEIVASVELLERKGLCTKQALYGTITEFRPNNPLFELGRAVCRNGTVTWIGRII